MNVADISPRHHPEVRRVWIAFDGPGPRTEAAVRIYRELDIAVDLEGDTVLSIATVRTASHWFQGLLERFTGRICINDWDHLPHTERTPPA